MRVEGRKFEIRAARIADLDDVEEMVQRGAAGHPSPSHPRPRARLGEAYFGCIPSRTCLGGEAFHALADLAGLPPRDREASAAPGPCREAPRPG